MSAFAKHFLLEDARRLKAVGGRQVCLGAFGKHPGWADHVAGLPLDTETIRLAKQILYDEGIAGNTGAWRIEDQKGNTIRCNHFFVWQRGESYLVGRLWYSRDGSKEGRDDFPMVVCFHTIGLPLDWVVRHVFPKLERIREAFEPMRNPNLGHDNPELQAEIQALLASSQDHMRQAVAQLPPEIPAGECLAVDRERFLNHPDLGPEREGLWRVVHKVRGDMAIYLGGEGGSKSKWTTAQPQQMRLPLCAGSSVEAIALWSQFFNLQLDAAVPRLLMVPADQPWLDLIVGQPVARDFFCLRASLAAIPLTSSIPYTLDEDLKAKGQEIVAAFRQGSQSYVSATTFLRAKDDGTGTAKTGVPAIAAPPVSQPAGRGRRVALWVAGAVALVVVAFVAMKLMAGKPGRSAPQAGSVTRGKVEGRNTPPVIGSIQLVSIKSGGHIDPISLLVSDSQTPASNLVVRAASDNPALLPESGIKTYFRVTGWMLELQPASGQTGQARIKITADDQHSGTNSATFVLTVNPDDREFQDRMQAGGIAERSGKWIEARSAYAAALKLKPGDTQAVQQLTFVQGKLKEIADAEQMAKDYKAKMEDGQRAEQESKWIEAKSAYEAALTLKKGAPQAGRRLAFVQGKIDEQTLAQKREDDYKARMSEGQTAENVSKWAEAMSAYEAALKLKQGDRQATERLSIVQGKIDEQTLAQKREDDYKAKMSEGQTAEKASKWPEAKSAYEAAQKLKPSDTQAALRLTFAQRKLKEIADAEQLEKDYRAKMTVAQQAEKVGRLGEAEAAYRDVLVLKPDHAEASVKIKELAPKIKQQLEEADARKLTQCYARLDCFKVWFSVGKPSAPKVTVPQNHGYPNPGQRAERMGSLGPGRNNYVKLAERLKSDFRGLQKPPEDAIRFIDSDLIPAIRDWD